MKTESVAAQLIALEEAGYIKSKQLVEKDSKPMLQQFARINEELLANEEKLKQIMSELDKSAMKQASLLANIYFQQTSTGVAVLLADALKKSGTTHQTSNALVEKGYIEIFKQEVSRINQNDNTSLARRDEFALELTTEQKNAVDKINKSINTQDPKPFLLHRYTGSGKTLVYIHAIKHAINNGNLPCCYFLKYL